MALEYHYVLPPSGPADAAAVREMFDDVKNYVDALAPSGSAAPADAKFVTLATNVDLTQERVLTGTANQITITDNGAGSTVVLSLPQSIAITSSPSFAAVLYRNSSGNTVTIQPKSSFSNYVLTLPVDDGTSNQVLTTDGAGVLSWTTPSSTGANTALSNLASVAVNISIPPGTTNTIDLGDATHFWRDVYIANDLVLQEASGTNLILVKAPGSLASYTLTLPDSGGTVNYVLRTDGSGTTSWVAQTSTSGLATVALDNLSGVAINTSLLSDTDATDDLGSSSKYWNHIFVKDATFRSAGLASEIIVVKTPGTIAASYTLTLPPTGGTNNYILKTDGSGTTDWVSAGSIIAGATIALDNLSSVAVNVTISPGNDQSIDLGSTSKAWENIYGVNLYSGRSGVPGIIYSYPVTASKGHTIIQSANNTGNTETTIQVTAQAGIRTYSIPDSGASASFVMTEGTQTINGNKTVSALLGTMAANLAAGGFKITGLANGSASTDSATFGQLKILQIVTASNSTAFTTTSSTYQTSNLSLTITPTSASSRIFIIASGGVRSNAAQTAACIASIFRGTTDLDTSTNGMSRTTSAVTGNYVSYTTFHVVDSPATVAATTYSVKVKNDDNVTTVGFGNGVFTSLTAFEIV